MFGIDHIFIGLCEKYVQGNPTCKRPSGDERMKNYLPCDQGAGETTSGSRWRHCLTLYMLPTSPIWELTTLSSTCCNNLICTWIVVAITSFDFCSVLKTFNHCSQERSCGWWVSTPLLSRGLLATWQAGNLSVWAMLVVSSTGALHGTVVSPFLFTLYTTNFQ